MSSLSYFVHPTAVVDAGSVIGEGTKIWHFCPVVSVLVNDIGI
jgi:UDP-2-acetamido-3-amino-2,3-dideoxy-glucuronate N-acetyltransferase